MSLSKHIAIALTLAICIAVATPSRSAHAETCAPDRVQLGAQQQDGADAQLQIHCSDTNKTWLAWTTLGCYPRGWDVVKGYLALAQAALLSGKKLDLIASSVDAATCGGSLIAGMELVR